MSSEKYYRNKSNSKLLSYYGIVLGSISTPTTLASMFIMFFYIKPVEGQEVEGFFLFLILTLFVSIILGLIGFVISISSFFQNSYCLKKSLIALALALNSYIGFFAIVSVVSIFL